MRGRLGLGMPGRKLPLVMVPLWLASPPHLILMVVVGQLDHALGPTSHFLCLPASVGGAMITHPPPFSLGEVTRD